MAEKDIVGGIFGMTPEMYALNRDITGQRQAATLAAQPGTLMSPSLAPFYTQAAQQGQLLGRGIGGLLGVEDPELAKIRDVQQMRTQFDVSTPQGLRSFAQALGQKGYTDLALQATAKAADIDKDIAIAEDKREAKIKQVGLTGDGRQVYQSGAAQFVLTEQGPQPYYGKLESKTPKTEINMPGQRQILAVEAKKAEDLQKKIDSGYTVLERLNEQQQAIERGMIGGSFADTRTAIGTFASSLGLADQGLINSLANSKSFKANQNALAAAIAKQLGVNPTDKDFQASLDQFAKNSDDPKASLIFIKQMKEKFGQRQKINEDMFNSYIENDGTFRNYKGPKMVESFTSSSELEQLLAEKNKRTNKQK